jgi:hypothetical protein
MSELVKSRRDLETLVDDLLLTLKLNILRPLDETRDITLGLNILTNTKVLGSLFKQRVGSSLGGLLSLNRIRRRGNLLASRLFSGRRLSWSDKGSIRFKFYIKFTTLIKLHSNQLDFSEEKETQLSQIYIVNPFHQRRITYRYSIHQASMKNNGDFVLDDHKRNLQAIICKSVKLISLWIKEKQVKL